MLSSNYHNSDWLPLGALRVSARSRSDRAQCRPTLAVEMPISPALWHGVVRRDAAREARLSMSVVTNEVERERETSGLEAWLMLIGELFMNAIGRRTGTKCKLVTVV
jgi:hypothetical protein